MSVTELPSLTVFTEESLAQCEEGECVRCGSCCTVFDVDGIPGIPGDIHSPLIRKRAGERCPQQIQGRDGRYDCALYAQRQTRTDFLRICSQWSGDSPSADRHYRTAYEHMLARSVLWILNPQSAKEIPHIQEQLAKGGVRDIVLQGAQATLRDPQRFAKFLRLYLTDLRVLPDDIFQAINVRELIASFYSTVSIENIRKTIGLVSTDSLWQKFLQEYCV